MNHKCRRSPVSGVAKCFLAGAGLAGSLPFAHSQVAEEDEIHQLSPFVVDASNDTGYRASQTLAGGRTATNIKDVGTSIEVLTKAFLDDIGANSVEEYLQYTTGGEVGGSQGNFEGADTGSQHGNASSAGTRAEPHRNTRLRGLGSPDYVRNYYKTNIPSDDYNIDRVDINRGANSFLFGLGQPAGLINASYVQARMADLNELELQIGSGGTDPSYRASFNINRELVEGKLAIRLAALHDRKTYRQRPSFRNDDRVFGAITFAPFDGTTIRAHFERGEISGNAPDTLLPTQAFDTFIQNRTPIDFFDNMKRFGDPEGPNQEQWDALTEEERSRYSLLNRGGTELLGSGQVWGYAMVYDGSNGSQPSFALRPQIPNAQYEAGNAADGVPGDPFWSPDGSTGGGPTMLYWRNQRNRTETNGAGPAQGFTTLNGFDFSRRNFGGMSDFYTHDFRTHNVAIEQLFLDGQIGFEIGYDYEKKDNDALNNFNGWKGEFMIDINQTIPLPAINSDGSIKTDASGNVVSEARINPNYGRPMYATEPSRSISFEERETVRATAFARYDFAEKHGDSKLFKWLGKHTLSVLADQFTDRHRTASVRQQAYSDDFNIGWHIGHQESDAPYANYRALTKMVYFGPAIQSYINDPFNPSTAISLNDIMIQPSTADLLADNPALPITYWSLGPDAEGSNWTHRANPDLANNYQPPGNHALVFENQNPAYTGDTSEYWAQGNIDGRWTLNGGNNTRKTIVKSTAVNLQSMFLNNHLVANLGYREDVVENWLESIPQEWHELAVAGVVDSSYLGDRSYTVDPLYFNPLNGDYTKVDKGPTGEGSFGYGGVLHLPKDFLLFRTPESIDLSVHYNFSKNFVPDASRNTFQAGEDWSFGPLASPIGESEDIGFTIDFNNKFVARMNWYESSVQNATAPGMGSVTNGLVDWALTTRAWAIQDLNDYDPDGNGIIDVNASGAPHFRRNQAWWDLDRLHTVIDATEWVIEDGWEQAKLDGGYMTYNANGTVGRKLWLPGLQDTESRTSKGFEMNLTYNPTQRWRIALNLAKIDSVSSDVAPMTTAILDRFFAVYNDIKDFHLWDAADTRSHTKPFKNWFGNHINNYWVSKLQEGSSANETRKWSGSVITNYRFDEGRLKGFSAGGAVRYRGPGAIGYPLMDHAVNDEVTLTVPDVSNPFESKENWNVDVNFGYRRKIFEKKIDWDLRLYLKNINNLSSDELTVFRLNYDGTPANVRWDPPLEVRLVSKFKF